MASLGRAGWKDSKNGICHHQCPNFIPKICPRKDEKLKSLSRSAQYWLLISQNCPSYQLRSKTAFTGDLHMPFYAVSSGRLRHSRTHTGRLRPLPSPTASNTSEPHREDRSDSGRPINSRPGTQVRPLISPAVESVRQSVSGSLCNWVGGLWVVHLLIFVWSFLYFAITVFAQEATPRTAQRKHFIVRS